MSGWKLVPVEPTEEMLRAGAALLCDPRDDADLAWQREEWGAMVAASPEAPCEPVAVVGNGCTHFVGDEPAHGTKLYTRPAPDLSTIRAQARREALEEVARHFEERRDAYRSAGLDTLASAADSDACGIRALISQEPSS